MRFFFSVSLVLVMTTSFTRFVVALSFLRSGIGLQTTPANLVLISLSLFMTFYVMAPTFGVPFEGKMRSGSGFQAPPPLALPP